MLYSLEVLRTSGGAYIVRNSKISWYSRYCGSRKFSIAWKVLAQEVAKRDLRQQGAVTEAGPEESVIIQHPRKVQNCASWLVIDSHALRVCVTDSISYCGLAPVWDRTGPDRYQSGLGGSQYKIILYKNISKIIQQPT